MKKIICLIVSFLMLSSDISFAIPFRGEAQLILDSGLTDNPKQASPKSKIEPRFKDTFSPGRKIIFWATVSKKKEDVMKYVQSVEWYAPDGRVWYKENRQVFASAPLMFQGSLERTALFTLDTKSIPADMEGVWAVKFIWNNSVIDEHYFTYSQEPVPPTTSQIAALKNKMQRYDRSIALSNKSNYYKLSSHLARDARKLYKAQEVFMPDFAFAPDEEIIYMFNYDSTEFGLFSEVTQSNIYLFSPDGKLRKTQHYQWLYNSSDPDYICGFREPINLKKLVAGNKDLYGIWKLVIYIPLVNQDFDERYFYVGDNPPVEITREMVDDIDKKVNEDEIIKSLGWMVQMTRDQAINSGRGKNDRVRIDVGMSKDEVLRFIGEPEKILTNKYDDAVVWIYTSVNKIGSGPTQSHFASNAMRNGTSLGAGLIADGVVTGLCLMAPNKLEIVIKNDIVVSVKGSI